MAFLGFGDVGIGWVVSYICVWSEIPALIPEYTILFE